MKKLIYEYIKEFIENTGYMLLSEYYINSAVKLDIMCDNGHVYNVRFNDFQQGRRCPVCKKMNIGNRCRLLYDKVKQFIEDEEYMLLSTEYKNALTKLDIMCSKGHTFEMRYNDFQQGQRCPICYNERIKSNINLDEFRHYRLEVNRLTEKNYRKYKNLINPNNLPRSRNKYHLDHKYSVYDGFINKIKPEIISSIYNLQILSEHDNICKHKKSDVPLNEILSFVDENVKTESVEIKDEMLDNK
jgi:cytochrome c-type biogenesis protein CcmH/NrfF